MRKYRAANRERIRELANKRRAKAKPYEAEYRSRNRVKIREYTKEYIRAHPEQRTATNKRYYEAHKIQVKNREQTRLKTEPMARLKKNLRRRLHHAINGRFKAGSAVRDLGCTSEELRVHIESKFQPGMTWDNYGTWHIDHIVPLASFDLINIDELRKACNYKNLQPLWAIDNLRKGKRNHGKQ